MRKVTRAVCSALLEGRACKVGNTETDGKTLWLHGRRIAWRESDGDYNLTLAGRPTRTTRERLNGLLDLMGSPLRVCQHEFGQQVWRLDDEHARMSLLPRDIFVARANGV